LFEGVTGKMTDSKKDVGMDGALKELGEKFCLAITGGRADKFVETKKKIGIYVGRVYGTEMRSLVLHGKELDQKEPEYPTVDKKEMPLEKAKTIWKLEYDEYYKGKLVYERQKGKVFTLVLGHCDKALTNRLESLASEFTTLDKNQEVKGLLEMIKGLAVDANGLQYGLLQAARALKALMSIYQRDDEHPLNLGWAA
jgi:hypothetical protein